MAVSGTRSRRRGLSQRRRLSLIGLTFASPALLLFVLFLGLQVAFAFYVTFNHWTTMRPPEWAGLANYRRIFSDKLFWNALRVTVFFSLMYVPSVVVAGLTSAVLLNRRISGQFIFKALAFIPVLSAWIIVGVVWFFIYHPDHGIVNAVLRMLGLPTVAWLGNRTTALPALAVVGLWKNFGWYAVLFLAGLQDIPVDLHEAAAIDGASVWKTFSHVTLPLLRPTMALVTILAAIGAFQVFDLVFVMTDGGPVYATQTFSYYIYLQAFKSFKMGYAATMSFVLFAIILVLTIIQLRILRPSAEF
ncbi:MAG: sugar ABC transporter permease [Anaerolineae bacterium]|nr:sugar ABC transporter permease [Anaerolineae bacterium]